MTRQLPSLAIATLVAGAVLSCAGAPRSTADAALEGGGAADVRGTGERADLAPASLDTSDTSTLPDRAAEEDRPPDLRPEPTGLPLPPGVARPLRILDGGALLTGYGLSSCSHQEPPSGNGDRWCVFTVPGAAPKTAELWVMNVTKASSGEVPRCDGTSSACLRMTANLWTAFPTAGPGHPYSHAFDGDTLIFYADSTTTSAELHRGPIYAWRPGWSSARRISSERGLLCSGHPRAPVAYCLDDVVGDPMKPDSMEVRAGSLPDAAGGVLPSVGRARPFRADGRVAWQAGFSPKGDVFAVSSPDPDPGVEALRIIASDQTGRATPKEVLRDATSWAIANDGRTVYFLREALKGVNDLYVADLPAASAVTKLASNVQDYVLAGDGPTGLGVGFLTAPDAENTVFRLLGDTTMPSSVRTVFTYRGMLEDAFISSDGRYTAWRSADLLAHVVRNEDLGSCVLNTTERLTATRPQFLASSGLVFWTEEAPDDPNRQDGFVASPNGCQGKRRFAQGMYLLELPVGDRGFVFGDEHDASDGTVTLKYAGVTHVGNEWLVDTPVRVHERVDPSVTLIGTNPSLLVFKQKTGGEREVGTYLFGPVPF